MRISEIIFGKILRCRETRFTQSEISSFMCIPQSAISRYLSKYDKHRPISHLKCTGRPRSVSPLLRARILEETKEINKPSLRKKSCFDPK